MATVLQFFTDGFNQDMDPATFDLSIGQDMMVRTISTSQNMDFERGLARTRLGLQTSPGSPTLIPTGQLFLAEGLYNGIDSTTVTVGGMAITNVSGTAHLWALNGWSAGAAPLSATEITGPGFPPGSFGVPQDNAEVNGVQLIPTGTGSGMARWDITGTTYTLIGAASNYLYVTGHYSRAVGAFGSNVSLGHQTIGFSAQGDETNWTTLDAGSTVIADIPDSITGIKVLKGVVLLARTYGFHIGWATGVFPIIYNWRKYSDHSVGCMFPGTFRIYGDIAYFMSDSGIHTFDLVDIVDIGEGIYKEIDAYIQASGPGTNYIPIAFISTTHKADLRPSYNIFLWNFGGGGGPQTGLHWRYDIREKKWDRYNYTTSTFQWIFWFSYSLTNSLNQGAGIPGIVVANQAAGFASSISWKILLPTATLDQPAFLQTGQFNLIGGPTEDKELTRVLVVYNTPTAAPYTITVVVDFILNGVAQSSTFTFQTYAAGGWDKRWVNVRQVGDFFRVKVMVPVGAPTPVLFKYLALDFSEVGRVRT